MRLSGYKHLDNFLDDLATARAWSMALVQFACTGKAGEHVSSAPMNDIAITWAHTAQPAGLQHDFTPFLALLGILKHPAWGFALGRCR